MLFIYFLYFFNIFVQEFSGFFKPERFNKDFEAPEML